MTIRIDELTVAAEREYEQFLMQIPTSLLYHSLAYKNFLNQILGGAKARYLLAYEHEKLMAAMPVFVKQGRFGAVVNSLPFYGSNGSIVMLNGCSITTQNKLLLAFDQLCREENAISSTIIENPLENSGQMFNNYAPSLFDERIGQITPLPADSPPHEIEDRLMSSFHVKTRNLVRKGKKSGFEITHDGSERTMQQLSALHESNMRAIGGQSKQWLVFNAIMENFEYDKDYRVYTATKDGDFTAGLLVFFFNQTAEYFTPVIHPGYRSEQPLSYLIFIAMLDAISKGCVWWNWGGTWLSQHSVYHFKSRWGTKDYNYRYLIKVHSDVGCIKKKTSKEILEAYPYFYVLPFSEINANE